MLGLLQCDEEPETTEDGNGAPTGKTKWLYSLNAGFDRETLLAMTGKDGWPWGP
jgi:hypothetical protein